MTINCTLVISVLCFSDNCTVVVSAPCTNNDCNGQGKCVNVLQGKTATAQCICSTGYMGANCDKPSKFGLGSNKQGCLISFSGWRKFVEMRAKVLIHGKIIIIFQLPVNGTYSL